MYELIQVANNTYYVNCPAKIGVYRCEDNGVYLDTLDKIEALTAKAFVPSHAEVCTDIHELAELNRRKVLEIADKLLELCSQPMNFEVILQRVFNSYGLTLNFEQYALVGSTVRSYFSWLYDSGKMTVSFEDNLMLWQTVS